MYISLILLKSKDCKNFIDLKTSSYIKRLKEIETPESCIGYTSAFELYFKEPHDRFSLSYSIYLTGRGDYKARINTNLSSIVLCSKIGSNVNSRGFYKFLDASAYFKTLQFIRFNLKNSYLFLLDKQGRSLYIRSYESVSFSVN